MIPTVWAVVKQGKIELLEPISLPEGAKLLVTIVPPEEEADFWLRASELSLAKIWDNPQDDEYTVIGRILDSMILLPKKLVEYVKLKSDSI